MNKKSQRGSALLVTLMVMVGLSLLGLGFVAISETESAISTNQRNSTQCQAVAEAGARAVVEWFQDPSWARSLDMMPPNNGAHAGLKITRIYNAAGTSSGVYKSSPTTKLFDLPFGPGETDRFYGTEQNPDILINRTTEPAAEIGAGNDHITRLNQVLFGNNRDSGEITEIRVYAPPIDGAQLVANATGQRFFIGGTRYGVATIQVTAQKFAPGDTARANPLASKTVRTVVGPFPLPIPGGPIQTASTAGINFGGASDVYWGLEMSAGPITDTKNPGTLPWANPYERAHFERGYDDAVWPYPVAGSVFDNNNYLQELVEKTYQDPWFGSRAFTTNSTVNPGYDYFRDEILPGNSDPKNRFGAFAQQDADIYPTKKMVRFPDIRYAFWKRITQSAAGNKGLYYFACEDATCNNFKRNGTGTSHPMAYWVNTTTAGSNLGPGIYFFDTKTGANPQNADGSTNTAILTPAQSWNSGDFNGSFRMVGFIYMNVSNFSTQGAGNAAVRTAYNMPGEPFRDIGYRVIDPTTKLWITDASAQFVSSGASNGVFDYQDLNGNGRLDIITEQRSIQQHDEENNTGVTRTINAYFPKVWNGAAGTTCTIPAATYNGTNAAATDCSEPHEPYLNMVYPVRSYPGTNVNSPSRDVIVKWEAGLGTQRQKKASIACSAAMADWSECTSNSYDDFGAILDLDAILDGILYNEGSYDPAGNAEYYGALLYRGAVTGTGNPLIYFDESLVKGTWAPAGMPRVLMYNFETDDQN